MILLLELRLLKFKKRKMKSNLNKKLYGVLGLARSGIATVEFLIKNHISFIAWDDNEQTKNKLLEQFPGVVLVDINDKKWLEIDCLVISPGIPTTFPRLHPLVAILRAHHIPIICDIALLYKANNLAKFIVITGTNGKSTTTALIGHILKTNKVKTEVGGNIGIGALALAPLQKEGVYVIEASSYQLELLENNDCHFNISVLLNITPDHLERHNNMGNYIKAKCNIFNNQSKQDCAIISVDNPITKEIYHRLKSEKKIGTIIPISTKQKLEDGISIINQQLEFKDISIALPSLSHLKGDHNAENIAASYGAAQFLELNSQQIINAIISFPGLDHRLQFVDRYKNIVFFNDSKGTNAESTEKALLSFTKNIYWIVGGQPKTEGIKSLAPLFNRVKHAFIIGDAQEEFAETIKNLIPYTKAQNLANAFKLATEMALIDDSSQDVIILLSPACASWDQWKDFEERGRAFCNFVKEFLASHR
jgi:UDP-N-acetylmuramoylalanine--D-glutamate ligase